MDGEDSAYPAACPDLLMSNAYGLTKRELFAAMAMQSLAAHDPGVIYITIAQEAVKLADELIFELSRKSHGN